MAFWLHLFISLVLLNDCLGKNTTSHIATSSLTSHAGLSMSTAILRPSSRAQPNIIDTTTTSLSPLSSSLSTSHPNLNTVVSRSSLLQTQRKFGTVFLNNTRMEILSKTLSPSTFAGFKVNKTQAINASSVQGNSSNIPTQRATNSPTRESLLSGQLAGIALILFILVVLLLIICLGNFADEPVLNEREIFTEEVSMDRVGENRDNQGEQGAEEWKFDPLFAWSPRNTFDSKL